MALCNGLLVGATGRHLLLSNLGIWGRPGLDEANICGVKNSGLNMGANGLYMVCWSSSVGVRT